MTGTATTVSVDGTDTATLKTAIEGLGIVSADKVIFYTIGNTVFITRYQH